MTRNVYKYKPLLFTTTMRNPERLKDFLLVLQQYDRQILTGEIITKVVKELISKGLYKPTKASELVKQQWKQGIELSITLTEQVYAANPQSHKEAGFEKGWPSRFDTWFKISKELGLVYYRQNEQISFSETGLMLLDKEKPENEQLVFANAFAKYQRHNPFRKVLNKNIPLILLLQTIQYLNKDKDYNGAGIARKEIPLLLCWQNNNALELYHKIKQLRNQYGFAISDEVMLEQCYALLDEVKRDNESILNDYPDDFIRKMRLTGLISIRGGGRFVDINAKETKAVTYIIENYANYLDYESEEVFFNFISKVDKKLVTALTTYHFSAIANKKELQKWTTFYSWEQLKTELLKLAHNNPSNDAILKLIEKPLRLEFLTTLAILKKIPHILVKPNYISDDEGLPIGFASGGNPDIECYENNCAILVEVTLLTGTQQHIRESYAVQRHLEDFLTRGHHAFSLFISPKAFIDTCRNAAYIRFQYGHEVKILDIPLFVTQLENNSTLHSVAHGKSSCN